MTSSSGDASYALLLQVVFAYGRMVRSLVRILNIHSSDSTTPRVVTYLLNSMACHVEGQHKIEVGIYGAIEAVVEHVRRKVLRENCDEVLEVSCKRMFKFNEKLIENEQMVLQGRFCGIAQTKLRTIASCFSRLAAWSSSKCATTNSLQSAI